MYVNVNKGERLDFGETVKTATRRRFLGAISFLYHHDNVIFMRGSRNFRGAWWGWGPSRMTGKNSDFFLLLHLFCKSSIHFAGGVHFKFKVPFNYTFPNSMEEGSPTFLGGDPTFPREWGPIAYSYA